MVTGIPTPQSIAKLIKCRYRKKPKNFTRAHDTYRRTQRLNSCRWKKQSSYQCFHLKPTDQVHITPPVFVNVLVGPLAQPAQEAHSDSIRTREIFAHCAVAVADHQPRPHAKFQTPHDQLVSYVEHSTVTHADNHERNLLPRILPHVVPDVYLGQVQLLQPEEAVPGWTEQEVAGQTDASGFVDVRADVQRRLVIFRQLDNSVYHATPTDFDSGRVLNRNRQVSTTHFRGAQANYSTKLI